MNLPDSDQRQSPSHSSRPGVTRLLDQLWELLELDSINSIKERVTEIMEIISWDYEDSEADTPESNIAPNLRLLKENLGQIRDSHTPERSKYYIRRLLKSITSVERGRINDLNLNRWKEYDDLITDSLWIMDKRDSSGAHNASYWGNFIPQIPNQLIRRFTKRGDWILDTFLGSGTTLIECKRLGRNGVGIDLSAEAIKMARENLSQETAVDGVRTNVLMGDSTLLDYPDMLSNLGIESVQLAIMHPPYWDIIRFSEMRDDLSNSPDVEQFIAGVGTVAAGIFSVLEPGRHLALVIGDKYSKGEWIPLGFRCMESVLSKGFKLKSVIVKNYDATKGKRNQKELWRYRALKGGFYVFKHEYVFLFQKPLKYGNNLR